MFRRHVADLGLRSKDEPATRRARWNERQEAHPGRLLPGLLCIQPRQGDASGAAAVSPPIAGFLSDLIGIPGTIIVVSHVNARDDSVRISSQGPTPHGFRLRPDLASGPAGAGYELVINLKTAKARSMISSLHYVGMTSHGRNKSEGQCG
jgi:hypothetical protein